MSDSQTRWWSAFLMAVLLGLSVTRPAVAQSSGSIIGVITDTSGAVLPGVTVTATSPALQVPSIVGITDAKGEYRLGPLPPGVFTVTFELSGFQPVKRENVRLTLGFTATLDQALGVGPVQESVTVSGASPLVDVTNPATSVDMSKEALEILPTSRDGLKAFMNMMPGVRTNLDVGASSLKEGPQFRTHGQSAQSWQMVDGIMFSSANTGGSDGAQIDFNATDSTRIQTTGSGAEMQRRGILLDSILKSGGNEFHGDATAYGSADALEGSNLTPAFTAVGIPNVAKLHEYWDVSATLGGRIVRNKLWFFAAIHKSGFNREILDAVNADGSPMVDRRRVPIWSAKLSYQMNQANKLTGFYHTTREGEHRLGSRFIPTESREVYDGPVAPFGGSWQMVHGSSLVASVQTGGFYQKSRYFAEPSFDSGTPEDPAVHKIGTLDTFTMMRTGDTPSDGRTVHRYRYPTKGTLSYYQPDFLAGSHQFKTGFDFINSGFNEQRANKPAGNYELRFNNGAASQLTTFNYPVTPKDFSRFVGVYGQDAWTIGRRLNLVLGLRLSTETAWEPAACHAATQFSAAACYDRIDMRRWTTWLPHLHGAYDLFGDGKSVLRGGYGRFANLRDISPELTRISKNNAQTTTWTWHDLNSDKLYQPGEVNLDPNGSDFRSIAGGTNAVVNPNEPQPKSDEWSLTYERELKGQWAIWATGVYARNFDLRRLAEPLRPRSAYSIAITNPHPGNDGLAGTADDPIGKTITYYEYPASLNGVAFAGTMIVPAKGQQTFKTVEVAAERRIANGWQASGSFSATRSNVPFVDEQPDNPNSEINTASNTWEFTSKVSAGYTLPFEVIMSATYERRNGTAQAPSAQFGGGQTITQIVLNIAPIGYINLPSANLWNMRFAKRIRLGPSRSLEARFDFFNIFNANFVTARSTRVGPSYLIPSAIILPRILQTGLTYAF
jgi:Carboxypeptidase regulatory-like domain